MPINFINLIAYLRDAVRSIFRLWTRAFHSSVKLTTLDYSCLSLKFLWHKLRIIAQSMNYLRIKILANDFSKPFRAKESPPAARLQRRSMCRAIMPLNFIILMSGRVWSKWRNDIFPCGNRDQADSWHQWIAIFCIIIILGDDSRCKNSLGIDTDA